MRILVVHQYYLLPGLPGGSRFNELARLWSERGHEVTVVAGDLDYSTGIRPPRYRGRFLTSERDGRVVVWRARVPPAYSRSYLGRAWAYFGFTVSSLAAVCRVARPDVVVATSPPLTVFFTAWFATRIRFRGVPWVFEVRDLWPESAVTTGVLAAGSWIVRLLSAVERWACAGADVVNVLTPAFRDDLVGRGLVPAQRVSFVPNGADVDQFQPRPSDPALRSELGWTGRFVVLYSGAHGRANAIGQLVEAAERLRDRPDILIACVGDGPERARWEAEALRRGLGNIRFHGPMPKARMPEIVAACDVGAAVLQDNPTFRTVYPNKVFDYMACARPTLLAIDGAARRLVCDEARAGVFAPPEQPEALATAIRSLADAPAQAREMGARGRAWVLAHATREALADRYLEVLDGVARRAPRARGLWLKGLLDRTLALLGLVVLLPVLALLGVLVAVFLGRPVLFRQERPGLGGRPFRLVKLRTMREGEGPDASRLTRFGRLLRATSLDELPELWNVLRGEMSLVGPRPLLMQYLPRYSPRQARRHEMKPGLTGWAQVNGRNQLSWDERLELDVWYVENWSPGLDGRILARTLGQVLRRRGISHPGAETMPEFTGPGSDAAPRGGRCA